MIEKEHSKPDAAIEPMSEKSIMLIGMRGSGKTTIARMLAQKTGKQHVDTDDIIVERTGMKIPDIVRLHGLEYFRDRESDVIKELSERQNLIVATGGGVIVRPQNIPFLKKNSICVWLQASIPDLVTRTGNDPNRLPLTDKATPLEEVTEVLGQRTPLYQSVADEVVDTEGRSEEDAVDEILRKLKEKHIQ